MARWYTSDPHFSHNQIMLYTDRHEAWSEAEDMFQGLVDNWNKVVKPGDEVFVLGDFAFKHHASWLARLAGSKYLIKGSHDRMGDDVLRQFAAKPCTEMVVPLTDTTKVLLHHTAIRIWEKCHYGQRHLFGHSHGRLGTFNMSRDCGVDCKDANYTPFSADYLAAWFDRRELEMRAAGRIVKDEKPGRTGELYRSDDVAWLMEQYAKRRSQGDTEQEVLRGPVKDP